MNVTNARFATILSATRLISCRLIANDGVRARVDCTPSDEQKPCWLLLVRFP